MPTTIAATLLMNCQQCKIFVNLETDKDILKGTGKQAGDILFAFHVRTFTTIFPLNNPVRGAGWLEGES